VPPLAAERRMTMKKLVRPPRPELARIRARMEREGA